MPGRAEEAVAGHFTAAEEGEKVIDPGDDGRQHNECGKVHQEHDGVVHDGRDTAPHGAGRRRTEVVAGSDVGGADALLCFREPLAARGEGGIRGHVRAGPLAGSHGDGDECDARAPRLAGCIGGTDPGDQGAHELFISRLAEPHAGQQWEQQRQQ